MDAMRWTILGVGVAVLIAIYALGRWREQRRRAAQEGGASGGTVPSKGGEAGVTGAGLDGRDGSPEGSGGAGGELPYIDDDALRGIDELLADEEEPTLDDLELGPSDEVASPASGQAAGGEQGAPGPWWQPEPAGRDSSGRAPQESPTEAARATFLPDDSEAQGGREGGSQPRARVSSHDGEGTGSGTGAPAGGPEAHAEAAGTHAGRAAVDEPPPLKLPPASQVEIGAFRNGDLPAANKIVAVYVTAAGEQSFLGRDIEPVLRAVRMVPGEHGIWHRRGESEAGRVTLFSAANMLEPGFLDPEQTLPTLATPGLVFFMQLPLPVDGEETLDAMLATAYQIAVKLDGQLLDSTRSTMTRQVAEHMREQLREHRRQLHVAVHKR